LNCEAWVNQILSKPQPDEVPLDLIDEDELYNALKQELGGIPSGRGQIQRVAVDLDEKSRTGSIKAWDTENNQVLNLDLAIENSKTLLIDELKISDGIDVSQIEYGDKGRGVGNIKTLAGLIFALVPIAYQSGFKKLRNEPATPRLRVIYERLLGFIKGELLTLDRSALLRFCRLAGRFRFRRY
jgi:hypothetical protein